MRLKLVIPLLIVILILAGCARPGSSTPGPVITQPPVATATVTPAPQSPLVILVLSADMPEEQYNLYQSTIYDLAQQNNMRFQLRNALTPADLQAEGPALKIVIALPPDPGLADLVPAAPQVQFLAVDILGLPPAVNLSTIGGAGLPVDQQAFLAGYTAAMLALDHRVGIITREDANGMAAEAAFKNGRIFYCGLCRIEFGPQYTYPIHTEIPVDALESQYPAYADPLSDYLVEVAYVYPDVATVDLLEYMVLKGLLVIGESMLAEDLQPGWVVSIQPKLIPAIQRIFPELLAGKGGQNLPTPLVLADINPDLLSEGKQRLVQKLLDDLQAGFVSTGVTP